MQQTIFTVVENTALTPNIYRLILSGDTKGISACGQFVNLKIAGLFLRRPISVCDYSPDSLTLIYKVVGEGTKILSTYQAGQQIDILVGLGNGYDLQKSGDQPLLIGGGVGVPPLYRLCKDLISQGKAVSVILAFNTKNEIFYTEEFAALGAKVYLTTVDGSAGEAGYFTAALPHVGDYSYVYTCGPEPMLKSVYAHTHTGGQYSFEERMGCGFGACMGCTCQTKYGNKRICKDGPVLEKEEIIW